MEQTTYNMVISFGSNDNSDNSYPITISQNEKRTLFNRFKYWMLCQFFPFHVEKWDN